MAGIYTPPTDLAWSDIALYWSIKYRMSDMSIYLQPVNQILICYAQVMQWPQQGMHWCNWELDLTLFVLLSHTVKREDGEIVRISGASKGCNTVLGIFSPVELVNWFQPKSFFFFLGQKGSLIKIEMFSENRMKFSIFPGRQTKWKSPLETNSFALCKIFPLEKPKSSMKNFKWNEFLQCSWWRSNWIFWPALFTSQDLHLYFLSGWERGERRQMSWFHFPQPWENPPAIRSFGLLQPVRSLGHWNTLHGKQSSF